MRRLMPLFFVQLILGYNQAASELSSPAHRAQYIHVISLKP